MPLHVKRRIVSHLLKLFVRSSNGCFDAPIWAVEFCKDCIDIGLSTRCIASWNLGHVFKVLKLLLQYHIITFLSRSALSRKVFPSTAAR